MFIHWMHVMQSVNDCCDRLKYTHTYGPINYVLCHSKSSRSNSSNERVHIFSSERLLAHREIHTINAPPYHLRWTCFSSHFSRISSFIVMLLRSAAREYGWKRAQCVRFRPRISRPQSSAIEHVLVAYYVSIGISINRCYKTSFNFELLVSSNINTNQTVSAKKKHTINSTFLVRK